MLAGNSKNEFIKCGGDMAKRLTDKKKKKIIADYVECQNLRETSRRNNVSTYAVKKIVTENPDIEQKMTQKKEENTQDILSYLDSKTESLKKFGDYIIDNRLNPDIQRDELDKIAINTLVTSYGIMIDKALKSKEISYKTKANEDLDSINKGIVNIAEILKSPIPDRKLPDDE